MLITVWFSSHPISEAIQTFPGILSSSNEGYPDGLQGYAAVMEKAGPRKKCIWHLYTVLSRQELPSYHSPTLNSQQSLWARNKLGSSS